MTRFALLAWVLLGLALDARTATADWQLPALGGYRAWWEVLPKRAAPLTPEEQRLQQFWRDYYQSLSRYYSAGPQQVDWVAYHKNHGAPISPGAPLFPPGAATPNPGSC